MAHKTSNALFCMKRLGGSEESELHAVSWWRWFLRRHVCHLGSAWQWEPWAALAAPWSCFPQLHKTSYSVLQAALGLCVEPVLGLWTAKVVQWYASQIKAAGTSSYLWDLCLCPPAPISKIIYSFWQPSFCYVLPSCARRTLSCCLVQCKCCCSRMSIQFNPKAKDTVIYF